MQQQVSQSFQQEVELIPQALPLQAVGTDSTLKRIVSYSSITPDDSEVTRIPLGLDVDPAVGYSMQDIIVARNGDGTPAIDLGELNARNPMMRSHTSYSPGERRYLSGYESVLLKINNGLVYSYEDNIVLADSSRVFMMGGCGENLAGWAVATSNDGNGGFVREWDSPTMDDLNKDGHHRFGKLAVLVQRLGRNYFHWMTETLPRLTQFLSVLKSEPETLKRIRYLVYDIPFIRDALRLLGIDMGRQVIFFDENSLYTADEVFAISSPPCGQPPRPLLYHAQKHVFNYLYPAPPANAPPKLMIRAERRMKYANRRGLALLLLQGGGRQSKESQDAFENVEEVTEAVRRIFIKSMSEEGKRIDLVVVDDRKHNGQRKSNAKKKFLAQYSLWRRAELVVAMPGDSLANMMWSQNGTKIVELVPILPKAMGHRATITYADMAGSLELPYAMVPINATSSKSRFKVPINYLESALRLIMSP